MAKQMIREIISGSKHYWRGRFRRWWQRRRRGYQQQGCGGGYQQHSEAQYGYQGHVRKQVMVS
jgi:hypothetical protein